MFDWLKTLVAGQAVYPPAPDGVTIYAIGDVHGRADCLARAQDSIDRDIAQRGGQEGAIEIYLGDYVDRGPDSRGVIDRLVRRSLDARVVLLRGNHEVIMESFLRGQASFEDWRSVGGLETVLSYGVDARKLLANGGAIRPRDLAERLPASHLQFFGALRDVLQLGAYCFVHAGLRPGVPIERQTLEDMTWIRDDFLNYTGDFGFVVVHGHTPVRAIEFLPNRVNIDTGAYATNRLSVIRIDSRGVEALGPEE